MFLFISDFSNQKCFETREPKSGDRGEIVATAALSGKTNERWRREFGDYQSDS